MRVDEREQLQARDNGDLTDTVHVLTNRVSEDNSRPIKTESYHASPDCKWLKKPDRKLRPMSRAKAKVRGYAPCRTCVLGSENRSCQQYYCEACEVIVLRPMAQHLRHDCLATAE